MGKIPLALGVVDTLAGEFVVVFSVAVVDAVVVNVVVEVNVGIVEASVIADPETSFSLRTFLKHDWIKYICLFFESF